MGLTEYRLRELIELCTEKNDILKFGIDKLRGISIKKTFIETKADMSGVSLKPYYLVHPNDFSYVTITSRNGEKVSIAHNTTQETFIVSSSYVVFRVKNEAMLLADYLFMMFNRPEFDRLARFNSWGSAREAFSWDDLCDLKIELPDISIQQKYAAIYNAMLANQKSYERGLEDLKLVCDAYIDTLREKTPLQKLGKYISLSDKRNSDLHYGIEDVKGISIEKKFIETKANMEGVSLTPYAVVEPDEFAYVTVTSRNGERISLARNSSGQACICSSSYVVFRINDTEELLPEYLSLLFERREFDRYARFHSWGSARETFDWDEMCSVEIPVPDVTIQQDIVDIFKAYNTRKGIAETLKNQIQNICPILIKGSIEEAQKTDEA